ncbi:MAG: response regulator transcription factor [Treponema sp.]|nr:response regulator transcription factor [Treponema sp.]
MSKERILIIEDDPEIQEMLKFAFERENWKLIQVSTGEEGIKALNGKGADCVVLDIMLPGMDGLKSLKKIRDDKNFRTLPVIMCTARGEEADIISGLELGADDYVVKPYSPRVLAARIRAGLRRKEVSQGEDSQKRFFTQGKLSLDIDRHTAMLDKTALDLFPTEFAILAQFMSHPDIVFSRQKLISAIRGDDYPVTDRSIDVQIMGLRKKLAEAGDMVETIRGIGYRFKTCGE